MAYITDDLRPARPVTLDKQPEAVDNEPSFSGCSGLTSVVIPESVTYIGEKAFWGCSGLTSVVIPESVTSIGKWAFSECSSLTSVVLPESVTSIEERTLSQILPLVF